MVEVCSPAVSEDRGHTSKVDGPESLSPFTLALKTGLAKPHPLGGLQKVVSKAH